MVFQWGKNKKRDYEIDLILDLTYWALPLSISWWRHDNALGHKSFDLSVRVLCFLFVFEVWTWSKETLDN